MANLSGTISPAEAPAGGWAQIRTEASSSVDLDAESLSVGLTSLALLHRVFFLKPCALEKTDFCCCGYLRMPGSVPTSCYCYMKSPYLVSVKSAVEIA